MNKIRVKLANCYGIKSLEHEFDFSGGKNSFLIYASNGAMKTSFAQVFDDLTHDPVKDAEDRIFPGRVSQRSIVDETDSPINGTNIFVVRSDNFGFDPSQKMSTLLVSQDLKKKHDAAWQAIEDGKEKILKSLGAKAGIRKDIEKEIFDSFPKQGKDIFAIFEAIRSDVEGGSDDLSEIPYRTIINKDVLSFLEKKETTNLLANYIKKYNALVSGSPYFRQGGFNHDRADSVGKSLEKGKFFDAEHKVLIFDSKTKKEEPVSSQKELNEIVAKEKARVLGDAALQKSFDDINDAVAKKETLQEFRDYLEQNQEVLLELVDIDTFRRKLWLAYITSIKDEFLTLLSTFDKARKEIAEIVTTAQQQETDWQNALDRFKERFSVPFKIRIENKEDLIVAKSTSPVLVFEYEDGEDKAIVGRDSLLNYLSNGEKRAFYILNIIFEIEVRKKQGKKALLIFDDIADSFDYKNKYAIIEYLKEISENDKFLSIILTHNFDFFRTIHSRFDKKVLHAAGGTENHCLMAAKENDSVRLLPAPFRSPLDRWRKNISSNQPDHKIIVASIPMVRNLVEYARGNDGDDYKTLTALLHWKQNTNQKTESITCADLVQIFGQVLNCNTLQLGTGKVIDLIFNQADACLTAHHGMSLENKVVLSIAIRHKAEKLMIEEINDPTKTDAIEENQTAELFEMYRRLCAQKKENIKLFGKVVMITPEIIHLNSFMYEPLIDISDHHLQDVYKKLKALEDQRGGL